MSESTQKMLSGIAEMARSIQTYVPTGLFQLKDTPTGYQGHSGDYLVVNDGETGIHFTGIEKIAADLTDYGFGGTTLNIPKYTTLPDPITNDGKIVASSCDLYYSCDGEWEKIIQFSEDVIPETYPVCVKTQLEMIEYDAYKDEIANQQMESAFVDSLNGESNSLEVRNVCLLKKETTSSISINPDEAWNEIASFEISSSPVLMNYQKNTYIINDAKDKFLIPWLRVPTTDQHSVRIVNEQGETLFTLLGFGLFTFVSITSDFKYIAHMTEISSENNDKEINLYKLNESNNSYESYGKIEHSVWTANRDGFRISENGQKIACSGSGKIGIFEENGGNWELVNEMTFSPHLRTDSTIPHISYSPDLSKFVIEANILDTGSEYMEFGGLKFYEIDYVNNIVSKYMQIEWDSNDSVTSWVLNDNFDTLVVMRTIPGQGSTHQLADYISVYKYIQSSNSWVITNQSNSNSLFQGVAGKHTINSEPLAITEYALSPNGDFIVLSLGEYEDTSSSSNVPQDGETITYYYDKDIDQWIQYGIDPIIGSASPLAISNDGSTIVSSNQKYNTLKQARYRYFFINKMFFDESSLTSFSSKSYNNTIFIEESTYKWGIFLPETTINLNGSIDPDCSFIQWQSSDAVINQPNTFNTSVIINNDSSITGVFNCT